MSSNTYLLAQRAIHDQGPTYDDDVRREAKAGLRKAFGLPPEPRAVTEPPPREDKPHA